MASDFSELRKLATDLRNAPRLVGPEARGVIETGALNIKNQMREEAQRKHWGSLVSTITYDIRGGVGSDRVEAEIGPERRGQGKLAGIAYFGGAGWTGRKKPGRGWQQGPGGGGTIPDPMGALEAEAPNVERYLAELAEKALR